MPYIHRSKSNASYFIPWKLQQLRRTQQHYQIKRVLSCITVLFNTVTTISSAFLPAMNKSLHATLVNICMAVQNATCLSYHCPTVEMNPPPPPPPPPPSAHIQFDLQKHSASAKDSGCYFFLHECIQFHPFASYVLPCQMPMCQTSPLLTSVTRQQDAMKYWWEGSISAILPPSASDIVGQT